jgi:GT2 family glycosyltransferase
MLCGVGIINPVATEILSKYILLLNPDVILFENSLSDSINFLNKNLELSVLGVKNLNQNNNIVASCARFPNTLRFIYDMLGLSKLAPKIFKPATIMNDWNHINSKMVNHVIGAYMMIRASVLDNIGYFDSRFFLYLEDLDLSKRVIDHGGKIFYCSDIAIIHEGGGTTKFIKAERLFYSLQSRIIYCNKYFNKISTFLLIILSLIIEPISRLGFLILKTEFKEIPNLFKAYKKYLYWILKEQ